MEKTKTKKKLKKTRPDTDKVIQTNFEFLQKQQNIIQKPKIFISVNKKIYRAITPEKAKIIAKKLGTGTGKYKVHVIYGQTIISKRKKEVVENEGKYNTAREARQAIVAFIDESLWTYK